MLERRQDLVPQAIDGENWSLAIELLIDDVYDKPVALSLEMTFVLLSREFYFSISI